MVTKLEGQITLSSCEILHIIGSLGKDDFFGIDDGYIDMDDIEISGAIANAENSLIDKGYAELDFNGNFSVFIALKHRSIHSRCSKNSLHIFYCRK